MIRSIDSTAETGGCSEAEAAPSLHTKEFRHRYLCLFTQKSPEIRLYEKTESYSEESRSHGRVGREVSDFNKQDTQSDKDVTPH